ncbi:MAG: hypothetical protein VB934_05475, partial [Polyangiaceae bacterium]
GQVTPCIHFLISGRSKKWKTDAATAVSPTLKDTTTHAIAMMAILAHDFLRRMCGLFQPSARLRFWSVATSF